MKQDRSFYDTGVRVVDGHLEYQTTSHTTVNVEYYINKGEHKFDCPLCGLVAVNIGSLGTRELQPCHTRWTRARQLHPEVYKKLVDKLTEKERAQLKPYKQIVLWKTKDGWKPKRN